MADQFSISLNVIDVNILGVLAIFLVAAVVAVFVEFETDALVALVAVRVGLVDLCVLGEFTVGFQGTGFVGRVLEDDITLIFVSICRGLGTEEQCALTFSSW